jgi:aryl-alcohol dehydrogenase-like predicted oxidoreductase
MWGGTDQNAAIEAIQLGIDLGINLIDTAPVYGFGASEELVGKAIKGRRDRVVIATKCGLVWNRKDGEFFFSSSEDGVNPEGDREVRKFLGPDSIRQEVEDSLRRLQVDTIDLYQTHWQETTTTIADTMAELMRLKEQGKIRAIGVSNATPAQMDEYRTVGPLDSDQERYSMLDRRHESDNLPYCREHNVAFLAYSPLAFGLLTGKIGPERTFGPGDLREHDPRFSTENRRRVKTALDTFAPIAAAHDATVSQLVIAWTAAQPGCSHVLCGARDPRHVRENAAAADIRLTEEEVRTMTATMAELAL